MQRACTAKRRALDRGLTQLLHVLVLSENHQSDSQHERLRVRFVR